MDIFIYFCVFLLFLVLIFGYIKSKIKKKSNTIGQKIKSNIQDGKQIHRKVGAIRVSAIRARSKKTAAIESSDSSETDLENDKDSKQTLKTFGVKKQRKLQLKAEKKLAREVEIEEREKKKKKDEQLLKWQQKEEEIQKELERKQEEEKKKRKEELEKKQYEEYLKLKEQFSIEEEGCIANEEENETNLFQKFVNFIISQKVVVLEELASHFNLKTQDAIDRVQKLLSDGSLTGIIDDRGKLFYISMEELKSIAKFIKQHGRISISDLAEASNTLINLNPGIS